MLLKNSVLIKLKKVNIHGNIYGMLKYYLSNRSMRVKIDGKMSDIHYIENVTSQASVISPTLFN